MMIVKEKLHVGCPTPQCKPVSRNNQAHLKDKSRRPQSLSRAVCRYSPPNHVRKLDRRCRCTAATLTGAKPASPEARHNISPISPPSRARQQAAWSSGDYAVVGTTLQIVGEELCEALDLRPGQKVLDVAAGNGNVSLAAARRWCDVISTDYVPACSSAAARARRPKA